MAERHGVFSFPGILYPVSATYTCSHGVTPGVAVLRCNPQPNPPAPRGDLVISDGVGSVRIPDCKLDEIRTDVGGGGATQWTIYLRDRRWKWEFGVLFGCHNQCDPRGKLIPWTIRSPAELAQLCLDAMGEPNARIVLPPGLTREWGLGVDQFLTTGQNFPATGLNPPVNWDSENPARALQSLADQFGCRVVYNLAEDAVWIVPIGQGGSLPPGSIHRRGPTIKSIAVPDAVTVVGAPTKYQMRLNMGVAVGEDWDGSIKPIDQLSYAPQWVGKAQKTSLTFGAAEVPLISATWWIVFIQGVPVTVQTHSGQVTSDAVDAWVDAFRANQNARIRGRVTVTRVDALTVLLSGVDRGFVFTVAAFTQGNDPDAGGPATESPDGGFIDVTLTQAATPDIQGWSLEDPFVFANVRATERLTYEKSRELALKSVFRWYQLANLDVDGSSSIKVPGYGDITRKQMVVLTDTMVEQITPSAPDPRIVDPQNFDINAIEIQQDIVGNFVQNYYSGFSKDRPAVCYASYFPLGDRVWHLEVDDDGNTKGNEPVVIPFEVDPTFQTVRFASPVVRVDGDHFRPAKITLETGVYLRERETNQFACYTLSRPLATEPGQARDGTEIKRCPDVQLGVIGQYTFAPIADSDDFTSVLSGVTLVDADAIFRAGYYLDAAMLKYRLTGAETRDYNGVVPIACDGAISQVTWNVGDGFRASTTASVNAEHSTYVPPYPARRRAELLPPYESARIRMQRAPGE